MMKKSLSHTVWECKYHIVWVPKKRSKAVYGKLREEVCVILRRLSEYKGVKVIEGKVCIDHVHVCLSVPPRFSVSTIVGYLKGKSAMILFEKYSRLKKNFRGHHFWARAVGWALPTKNVQQIVNEKVGNAHPTLI
jgi:putative transposase